MTPFSPSRLDTWVTVAAFLLIALILVRPWLPV
jgi:hypothetical protein